MKLKFSYLCLVAGIAANDYSCPDFKQIYRSSECCEDSTKSVHVDCTAPPCPSPPSPEPCPSPPSPEPWWSAEPSPSPPSHEINCTSLEMKIEFFQYISLWAHEAGLVVDVAGTNLLMLDPGTFTYNGWSVSKVQTQKCVPHTDGNVTITLHDSWGDGWSNGGINPAVPFTGNPSEMVAYICITKGVSNTYCKQVSSCNHDVHSSLASVCSDNGYPHNGPGFVHGFSWILNFGSPETWTDQNISHSWLNMKFPPLPSPPPDHLVFFV